MSSRLYFACGMDNDYHPEEMYNSMPWGFLPNIDSSQYTYFFPSYNSYVDDFGFLLTAELGALVYDEFGIITPVQYDGALFEELKKNYYF